MKILHDDTVSTLFNTLHTRHRVFWYNVPRPPSGVYCLNVRIDSSRVPKDEKSSRILLSIPSQITNPGDVEN